MSAAHTNPCSPARIGTCVCLLVILFSAAGQALESDRDQPIEIESDSAELREQEGLTLYEGNVRMRQGSILVMADQISIYAADGKAHRLVAIGNQASYEQKPAGDQEKIIALGNRIEYRLADDVIHLIRNASLTQEGTTLRGDRITYDVRKHLLKASSQPDRPERVRIVIPPLNSGN